MRVNSTEFITYNLRKIQTKQKENKLKKQIQLLSSFVPEEILNQFINAVKVEDFYGVLLFVDISGIRNFFEKYQKTGKIGICKATETLNIYYSYLIEIISFYEGKTIKFAGNCLVALWKAPPQVRIYDIIHEVIVCSLFIKNNLDNFKTELKILINLKLIITCGYLKFTTIGNENSKQILIIGEVTEDIKNARNISNYGDVILAPSAWGHLAPENYETTLAFDGFTKVWGCIYLSNQRSVKQFYEIKNLQARNVLNNRQTLLDSSPKCSQKTVPESCTLSDLKAFVLPVVRQQIENSKPIEFLTKIQVMTILYINMEPVNFQNGTILQMADKSYQIISKEISTIQAFIYRISLFEANYTTVVLLEPNENVLNFASVIKTKILNQETVRSINFGVATGLIYFGVLGCAIYRQYTAIGESIEKAFQIAVAFENKIICDNETYINSQLSTSYFQVRPLFKFKNILEAGYIFEFINSDKIESKPKIVPLIGRQEELSLAETILQKSEFCGVCFQGGRRVGKTRLLEEIYQDCSSKNNYVCVLVLNGSCKKPYYSASKIYKQIFDSKHKNSPGSLQNVAKVLWDFTEILQIGTTLSGCFDSKVNIQERFLQIFPEEVVIIFIDNIEFIDDKSLELLDVTIQQKPIRLVMTSEGSTSTLFDSYKFLNNHIKFIMILPLLVDDITHLVCRIFEVEGISKQLLIHLNKLCEGRAGWVRSCLSKMLRKDELEIKLVSRNEIDYKFLENLKTPKINQTRVIDVSTKYLQPTGETSIVVDVINSFNAYQQQILKVASILGDFFTRSSLMKLLQNPKEKNFTAAIQAFFEEDIFDCGTKCFYSNEFQDVCFCTIPKEPQIPKYLSCKIIYFKNIGIKNFAYNLFTKTEKKELHLKCTELLENENKSCPVCLCDNSDLIINLRRYKDLEISNETRSVSNQKLLEIRKRRIWDSNLCFCLDIGLKIYKNLIYHSQMVHNLNKKIFFMIQYSCMLVKLEELIEAELVLHEAKNICLTQTNRYNFQSNYRSIFLRQIYQLLGLISLKFYKLSDAKNYALLCLHQFNLPLLFFRYSFPYLFFNKAWFWKIRYFRFDNTQMSLDFAFCMDLFCEIFTLDGYLPLAKLSIEKSLKCVNNTQATIPEICKIYSSAINLLCLSGDLKSCENHELYFFQTVRKFCSNNTTRDLVPISGTMEAFFLASVLRGDFFKSVHLGYRVVSLQVKIRAYYNLHEVIPILVTVLIFMTRIDDAVYLAQFLYNFRVKYSTVIPVFYYSFCLELILETNFYLEKFEDIENFAIRFLQKQDSLSVFEEKLIVNLYCYYLRYSYSKVINWEFQFKIKENFSFINSINIMRYTECLLLLNVYSLNNKQNEKKIMLECQSFLEKLNEMQMKWPIFRPRYLHLKAYHKQIYCETSSAINYLETANEIAAKQENILEKCWISLHLNSWFVGTSLKFNHFDWKLAKTYTSLEYSQILFSLPIHQ